MFLEVFVSLRVAIQHKRRGYKDWLIPDFDKLSLHVVISKVAIKRIKEGRKKWNEGKNQFKGRQGEKKNWNTK